MLGRGSKKRRQISNFRPIPFKNVKIVAFWHIEQIIPKNTPFESHVDHQNDHFYKIPNGRPAINSRGFRGSRDEFFLFNGEIVLKTTVETLRRV